MVEMRLNAYHPSMSVAKWILSCGVAGCLGTILLADGFRNPPDGPAAFGDFGGKAFTGDASAIQHNPANLMDLTEPQILTTATLLYGQSQVDHIPAGSNPFIPPAIGDSEKSRKNFAALPNLYLAWPFENTERFVGGFGIVTPWGRSSTWRKQGVFEYASPYWAQLKVIDFKPTLAMRVTDWLYVGGGVDIYYSDLQFNQIYPWFASNIPASLPFADGRIKIESDGMGYGGNIGMTVKFSERQRLGLTYRSRVHVEYNGDFEISNVPAGSTVQGRSDFSSDIDFPAVAAAGYSLQITESLRLEFDIEWLEWSQVDRLPLDLGSNTGTLVNNTGLPLFPPSLVASWRNTWTYGVGADWQLADNWMLKLGYGHVESPISNTGHTPLITDNDKDLFSVGLEYRKDRHAIHVAYAIAIDDDRDLDNTAPPGSFFNGEYDLTTHLVAVSYSYKFK